MNGIFKKLAQIDRKRIKENQTKFDETGDEKYLKKVKKSEKHLKEMERNIDRFGKF